MCWLQHDVLSWQGEEALLTELRQLAERRALRTLAVTQDLCDSLLALNDINGKHVSLPPHVLSLLGNLTSRSKCQICRVSLHGAQEILVQ